MEVRVEEGRKERMWEWSSGGREWKVNVVIVLWRGEED